MKRCVYCFLGLLTVLFLALLADVDTQRADTFNEQAISQQQPGKEKIPDTVRAGADLSLVVSSKKQQR
jgi:hypothetical protein